MSQEEQQEQEQEQEESPPNFALQKRPTGFYLERVKVLVSGMFLEGIWRVLGRCREGVRNVPYNNFAGSPKQFWDQKFRDQNFLGPKIFWDLFFFVAQTFSRPIFFRGPNFFRT